jgi:hypothetical protein
MKQHEQLGHIIYLLLIFSMNFAQRQFELDFRSEERAREKLEAVLVGIRTSRLYYASALRGFREQRRIIEE